MGDVAERKLWDKYMDAYEEAIRADQPRGGAWYVVPADNKWFARLVVAAAMVEAMESLEARISQGRRRPALEGVAKVRRGVAGGNAEEKMSVIARPAIWTWSLT